MPAVVDLVPLLAWSIAFALLYLLAQMSLQLKGLFSGLPWPLSYIGKPVADALDFVGSELKRAADGAAGQVVRWYNGLAGWVLLVIALPLLLAKGIYKALEYAWHTAIPAAIDSAVKPVRALANEAVSKVETLTKTVAHNLVAAEGYADAQAADALRSAKTWAAGEISAAKHAAEGYADEAVSKLRKTEDAAVASAVELATAARIAGERAAAAATATAIELATAARIAGERAATAAEQAAEATAARALAQAEAASAAALGQVKAIAIGAETDLTDLNAYIKSLGLPGAIAGLTALATLVTIALTETGLENASCRSKVKQICSTDTSAWTQLLEGLVPIGVAFSLEDLYAIARPLVDVAAPIIAKAA